MINFNSMVNTTVYEPTWITRQFNSLPHLNMWFLLTNATFDPYNTDYLETILFWLTVPILFLILLLLILIIYACCLVCTSNNSKYSSSSASYTSSTATNDHHTNGTVSRGNRKSKKMKASICKYKTFIILFTVLLSASLGFIVFGSETFHYSYKEIKVNLNRSQGQFRQINVEIESIKGQIKAKLNQTVYLYEERINDYKAQHLQQPLPSDQQRKLNVKYETAHGQIASLKTNLNEVLNSFHSFNLISNENNVNKPILREIDLVEETRWGIMIGIVTINLLLILLLIIGVIRNSKGSLCFFAFAAVLALISIWILNAFYMGLTVFVSDFCISPDNHTIEIAQRNQVNKNTIEYFTKCRPARSPAARNGFEADIVRVSTKLSTTKTLLTDLLTVSKYIPQDEFKFTEDLTDIDNRLRQVSDLVRCDITSQSYASTVNLLCYNSLFGLAIVVLSGIVFGLVLPFLICIIPQLWRRLNFSYYETTEEARPFIPVMQTRSNISAARQYNESPNFQRLQMDINTDPYMKTTGVSASAPVNNGTMNSRSIYQQNGGTPSHNYNGAPPNVPLMLYPNTNSIRSPYTNGTLSTLNRAAAAAAASGNNTAEQTLLIKRKF